MCNLCKTDAIKQFEVVRELRDKVTNLNYEIIGAINLAERFKFNNGGSESAILQAEVNHLRQIRAVEERKLAQAEKTLDECFFLEQPCPYE